MNTVISWRARIEDYLSYRRQLGYQLTHEASVLRNFAKFTEQHLCGTDRLTAPLAIQWARASIRQSPITWARRIEILRGFARYWQQFDDTTEIPALDIFGAAYRRLVPHIYTEAEIVTLLKACDHLVPINGLRPVTCRTVLGLLAATGLRISEAIHLNKGDVDLDAGVLTVREGKFHMSRLVPLHPSTTDALHSYIDIRNSRAPHSRNDAFFQFDSGKRATSHSIRYALHTLCNSLGWRPRGDYIHHRLHDFRHTFIVHSMLRTYRQAGQPDHSIQVLSTYVGHVSPKDTYWYLTGIPELMAIATERFQSFIQGE